MVIAYHVIFCTYGFWLPNDPRGSWSDYIGAWELLKFGRATTVNVRRSVAATAHDQAVRAAAKAALRYPPVQFTGAQARTIGEAFADYLQNGDIEVWACAILPQHVHMVFRRGRLAAEALINQLKGAATRGLDERGLHPFGHIALSNGRHPKMWARNQWIVYLNDEGDIERSIAYVERNPLREGLPRQRWSFVRKRSPTGRS